MHKKPTVIDFFCGAGGFSEGFRQQGFKIIQGIDNWSPAVKTFNHNFELNNTPQDILEFWDSVDLIEALPDTDVIIGSPPCISFSNSNRSGKADKALGLKLTEVFLRIVAVKKYRKRSVLKAWFMENVKNSLNYLPKSYTFRDLNLSHWSRQNGYSPNQIVITVEGNSEIVNSAEYGSAQARKRAIIGELIGKKALVVPDKTHTFHPSKVNKLQQARTLASIKNKLPKPNIKSSSRLVQDPSYNEIRIPLNQISDHFYDSGIYMCQWKNSLFMKQNHPYMGKMSFPEDENKPSRTVTATNIGTSREAIIYKSEFNRVGDGEYRVPTIREMACLMGFPLTYQFLGGSENTKSRLVGNAVCPAVSRSLANVVRKQLKLRNKVKPSVNPNADLEGVINLNTFSSKTFNKPPIKRPGSRFRRHPFKYGNITVTLSNYDVTNSKPSRKWMTSVQYGNGDGYPSINYEDGFYECVEPILQKFEEGQEFLEIINNGFLEKIANSKTLQRMYEFQKSEDQFIEPTALIEEVGKIINCFKLKNPNFEQDRLIIFDQKSTVPVKQVMALYAVNKIATITNEPADE